jgi:hypothetical protein
VQEYIRKYDILVHTHMRNISSQREEDLDHQCTGMWGKHQVHLVYTLDFGTVRLGS